jgi:serine/threonine protein kinase
MRVMHYMKSNEDLGSKLGDFYRDYKSEPVVSSKIIDEIHHLKDRYEIAEHLGEGGLKTVWAAKDFKTCRDLALAYSKEDDEESIEMLLREARVTASLNHPNIIPVYDIECESKPFFTMKKLGGKNLYDLLQERSFDSNPWFFLQIYLKVCDALAFAHSKGVIHLDLKPENIQVDDYGTVLLIDWGLAATYSDQEDRYVRAEGQDLNCICGTIGYISPEQINYQEGIIDERSDIYALGGLLHYILTGKIVLKPTQQKPFEKILVGDLNLFPGDLNLPEGLKAIAVKATQTLAEYRYQSVLDLQVDLDRYLKGFATFAENAGFVKQLTLLIKRNKKICLSFAMVSLLITCITLLFVNQLNREKQETFEALTLSQKLKIQSDELRQEAETNLERFKEEEQDKMIMVKSSADVLANQALSNVYSIGVEEALRRVELGLKAWPKSDTLQYKKAHLLFIAQAFNEVVDSLQDNHRGKYLQGLYVISKTYRKLKSDEDKLNQRDFINLLVDLKAKELYWLIKVFVLLEIKENPAGAIDRAVYYFQKLHLNQVSLEFDQSDGVIDSMILPFDKGFVDLSVFSGLRIKRLDLHRLKELNLEGLVYTQVVELILNSDQTIDYNHLNRIKGLKKVTLIGDSPSELKLGQVKEGIEVLFQKKI